jgi:hypothetical protein
MTTTDAISVIQALAEGVDPATGEIFPPESVYQRADIVRALFKAVGVMETEKVKAVRRATLPPKAGKPWAEFEDAQLKAAFVLKRPAAELGAEFQRTPGAIRARSGRDSCISGS